MLNPINTTMISVALVPISTALGLPTSAAIWLVVSLYLTAAISQPTMGSLADLFGPRTIYLTGFIAASIFGIPQGLGSVANQVVVYRQAPADQIGSASGLSRTSVSLTAIVASSIIGLVFGQAPSDEGLQLMGWIVVGAAVVAVVLTVFDRSLRRATQL